MDTLLQLDRSFFLWLNNGGSLLYDEFWLAITSKTVNVVVYIIAGIYFYKKTNLKAFISVLLFVGLMILFTDQITNLAKYSFARLRPCYDPEIAGLVRLVKDSCGGKYGFFSAHASNSFALAVFFSLLLRPYTKRLYIFFLSLASLIAYSRVYIGVHFPLDILCGTLVGCLSGYIYFRLWENIVAPQTLLHA